MGSLATVGASADRCARVLHRWHNEYMILAVNQVRTPAEGRTPKLSRASPLVSAAENCRLRTRDRSGRSEGPSATVGTVPLTTRRPVFVASKTAGRRTGPPWAGGLRVHATGGKTIVADRPAQQLIRRPGRIDDCEPVLGMLEDWNTAHTLPLPSPARRSGRRGNCWSSPRAASRAPVEAGCVHEHRPLRRRDRLVLPTGLRGIVDGWLRGRGLA